MMMMMMINGYYPQLMVDFLKKNKNEMAAY